MVARAPDERLSRDRIEGEKQGEQDPSTISATDNDTTPIDLNQDDGWPSAEGYTPLGDMMNLGSVMVAMPPEEEEHGHYYAPNSFVADPNALFGSVNATSHDNVYGADNNNDATPNDHTTTNDTSGDDGGFLDLASSALMALENDYETTLRGEVRPSFMDSQPPAFGGPAMPLFNAASFNNAATSDTDFADFDSLNAATPPKAGTPQKPLPNIDAAAVQKAVAGITTNTSLEAKLQKWQTEKDRSTRKHSLIPNAPLKAFHKNTPKAVRATANLSRSATIANCLHKLSNLLTCQERLSIHLVGADHVECQSIERVQSVLAPLVRWVGANLYAPKHLDLLLIGPNVPTRMSDGNKPIDLMPQQQTTTRLHSATAKCVEASYHDWLTSEDRWPDLVVCFNAGIWGYDEWKPTIRAVCRCDKKIPFVVTSYTLEEAEDDHDVVLEAVKEEQGEGEACLWGPEANEFGSKVKRETATAVEGREYRENAAWQAWRL